LIPKKKQGYLQFYDDMMVPWKWLYWANIFTFAWRGLVFNQYEDLVFNDCRRIRATNDCVPFEFGNDFLAFMKMNTSEAPTQVISFPPPPPFFFLDCIIFPLSRLKWAFISTTHPHPTPLHPAPPHTFSTCRVPASSSSFYSLWGCLPSPSSVCGKNAAATPKTNRSFRARCAFCSPPTPARTL
jgi:hypothetical protein